MIDVVRWAKPRKPTTEELTAHLKKEGTPFGLFADPPRTKYGRHQHDFNDFIVIVSGRMKLVIDSHEWILKPGDRIDIPANTAHWAEMLGKEEVRYFSAEK